MNLYTYCHNDGVNYFDPSGHYLIYTASGGKYFEVETTTGVSISITKKEYFDKTLFQQLIFQHHITSTISTEPEWSYAEMPFGVFGSIGVGATKEVAELGANKISHILQDKHLWNTIVENGKDWGEVSKVISKVMLEGAENTYKSVYSKTLEIGGKIVEVTYNKLKDGVIKISDAWVRNK